MKTGRRTEPDSQRRDARDRDMARFNRKRPSMLSEFHGKHHNYRDVERDSSDPPHFRAHNRYPHDGSPGMSPDYGNRFHFTMSGGPHNKLKPDPRGKRMHFPLTSHQGNYRSPHHQMVCNRLDSSTPSNDGSIDEEIPPKRPCLTVDVSKRAPDPPNSADSATGASQLTSNHVGGSPPVSESKTSGLSAYHLEDIDSDDDETLLKDEPSQSAAVTEIEPPAKPVKKEPSKPSKEELLQMMERVDREISALETQIATLQKKQAELEEGSRSPPPTPLTPSPKAPSPNIVSPMEVSPSGKTTPTSPTPDRQPVSKMSLAESIYSENRSKARSAHSLLQALGTLPAFMQGAVPLYFQPSEAPCYHANISSHRLFRPRLVEHLRRKKIARHQQELSLCRRYDNLMAEWERRVEKIETSSKKKSRDMKNRELFERTFPELKARREQQERFTRVDQRGFGVVRSDAELNELMYELSSKEEAPARYRKTHALIPPMIVDEEERRSRFISTNGHVADMMALHRDLKFTNIWSEEEKAIFREKFVMYPKNFEMIAKFLPNKSPPDCVKFYYLSKKSENFKQLVRKANLKRKKALIKPPELSLSSSLHTTSLSAHHVPSLLASKHEPLTAMDESVKAKSEFGAWSEENISCLKEGLRKYGRAWGKVYREVGGSKTATQCKMFYDEFCSDESLGLQEALLEHSKMKNAEKLRRKSQSRKPPSTEAKRKVPSKSSPAPVSDGDSENTESATESESNADGSESESTVTDSGVDEAITDPSKPPPTTTKPGRSQGSRKPHPLTSPSSKTSEDVVDLFLTAAEALKNNISPEVALHDHTYSLPPSQLVNSMDLQGTSGLSLIAAAAAVVSPNLSRNAGSSKPPGVSPVRAPRGRPPNKYRGGSSNSTVKLSPSLLSPAGGASANVLLSDIKNTSFRNRTRSAPTDRPKSSTIHIPRSGSTLAKMSLSSSSGRGKNMVSTVAYAKQKSDSPSLKSMIALQPPQTATSAFEALVNVAVAAPPAELPKASSGGAGPVLSIRNSVTKKSSASGRGSQSTPSPMNRVTLSRSNSNESSSSALNNGTATATAYIDVSEAIKIIASLAQQTPGSSTGSSHTISVQPLFAQSGSPIIGSIVAQGGSGKQATPTTTSSVPVTSNSVSVSATVDTLLSHLTSGVNKASPRSTPSPKPASRTKKLPKTESSKATPTEVTPGTSGDDLSNLKLLSSLVAAVAGTQASPSVSSPPVDVTTHTTSSTQHTRPTSSTVDLTQSWDHTHTPDNAEHSNSNDASSSEHPTPPSHTDPPSTDHLPRGVVRPPLSPYPPSSRPSLDHTPSTHRASPPRSSPGSITQASTDMTASLASIIPTYSPSVGQQSTLLLYTRSRSFPHNVGGDFPHSVGGDCVGEEEDHLESATRGISELSKLLGTDGNGEPESPVIAAKGHDHSAGFLNSTVESIDMATNGSASLTRVMLNDYSSPSVSEPSLKLSSLLESRGTVHHTSVPSNHGNNITGDTPLNIDAQSR